MSGAVLQTSLNHEVDCQFSVHDVQPNKLEPFAVTNCSNRETSDLDFLASHLSRTERGGLNRIKRVATRELSQGEAAGAGDSPRTTRGTRWVVSEAVSA